MNQSKKTKAGRIWIPTPEDFNDFIPEEKAKFVFDNAVLFHEGQIETTAILRTKVLSIFSFVFSLTLLVVTALSAIESFDYLLATHPTILLKVKQVIFSISAYCFVAIIFSIPVLLDMLKPKKLWCSGDEPQALIKKEKLCKSLAKIYIDRCLEYQKRINHNQKINEKSSKKIGIVVNLLTGAGILTVAGILLIIALALIPWLSQNWLL